MSSVMQYTPRGSYFYDQKFDDNSTPAVYYHVQPKRVAASANVEKVEKTKIILAWADESEYLTNRVRSASPMEEVNSAPLLRSAGIGVAICALSVAFALTVGYKEVRTRATINYRIIPHLHGGGSRSSTPRDTRSSE